MKILRFDDDRVGVLKGQDQVVDISSLISHREHRGPQGTMEELIGSFSTYRPEIEKFLGRERGMALSSVKLLVPLPRPSRVLAAFANYLDRPGQSAETLHNEFFHKSPELVGPEGTVELPDLPAVTVYHAEAELAFVIGKAAKKVAEKDAMDHVFGYMPFFDISARGLSRRSQLIPKGQDTFAVAGPWITTRDEVADPHALNVKSWVAGEPRQDYSTGFMAHKIPDQIAWASRFIQLQPGDVLATGTFHVGLGPINVGDTLEIAIVGLGKARFFVKGDSPRKDAPFQPGGRGQASSPMNKV